MKTILRGFMLILLALCRTLSINAEEISTITTIGSNISSLDELTEGMQIIFFNPNRGGYIHEDAETGDLFMQPRPEENSPAGMNYVWTVEMESGKYKFCSNSGRYIPILEPGVGAIAGTKAELFVIEPSTTSVGKWTIQGASNQIYFNANAVGSTFVGWNAIGLNCDYEIIPVETALTDNRLPELKKEIQQILLSENCVGGYTTTDLEDLVTVYDDGMCQDYDLLKKIFDNLQKCNPIAFNPNNYYRLENATRKTSTGNATNVGDGGWLEEVDLLDTPSLTEIKYTAMDRDDSRANGIWSLEPTNGYFTFRHLNTNTYIGGTNGTTPTADQENASQFMLSAIGWAFGQYYLTTNGGGLHITGTSGSNNAGLIIYGSYVEDGINTPSSWFIRPVENIRAQVDESGFAMLNYPLAVELPSEAEAYYCTAAMEDKLYMEKIDGRIIPPFTPFVLKAFPGDYLLQIKSAMEGNLAKPLPDNLLKGTTKAEKKSKVYVWKERNGISGFYLVEGSEIIPQNKAYFLPVETEHKMLQLEFGQPTNIQTPEYLDLNSQKWYGLDGKQTDRVSKGIYINESGRKVLVP